MSLNESKLKNINAELNMSHAKRSININANLPTDRIDERIAVLDAAMDIHKRMMAEDMTPEKERND